MSPADERRPVVSLWARAERERQMVRDVQEAEWRRRMVRAGGIDPEGLSKQGRRILVWRAEWDGWTVGGVVELLTAAHRAGRDAADVEPEPLAHGGGDSARLVEQAQARRAALERRRPESPGVGL